MKRAASSTRHFFVLRTCGLAGLFLLDLLPHRRRSGLGLLHRHDQMAQDGVVEAEGVLELAHHGLVGLDVQAQVVGLGQLVDLVGQP